MPCSLPASPLRNRYGLPSSSSLPLCAPCFWRRPPTCISAPYRALCAQLLTLLPANSSPNRTRVHTLIQHLPAALALTRADSSTALYWRRGTVCGELYRLAVERAPAGDCYGTPATLLAGAHPFARRDSRYRTLLPTTKLYRTVGAVIGRGQTLRWCCFPTRC